ncbi:cytochrome c peroxidase [Pontibacter sp. G13]|uniref:cytochrome-c peroxidase n=1 Tax=Pontibacter sp. G13 TaxID=3074898 RepID=UPI0028894E8C|nr:cytochrome c peroxidase [Pontibacter sp. G13]WNJ19209.1 cytochrome c peroxidase [Pontibacter sp. G13]
MKNRWIWTCTFVLGTIWGCQQLMPSRALEGYSSMTPRDFPEMPFPEDNAPTRARIELGRMLFFDPILSRDTTISCGTCHLQSAGLADHERVSVGIEGRKGFRNVPTLTNVGYHPYFFKEGGSPTLEMQVLGPLENEDEMGFNAALLNDRLQGHPIYDPLAQEAYGRPIDIYVVTRAIAAFERTMISGNSPYDQFQRGDSSALTPAQIRGKQLFFSPEVGCTTCHSGFDFTNYAMENIGSHFPYEDLGRYRISGDSSDIGKFKVPTLRNVAVTAPYFHDGGIPHLFDVLEIYNLGGVGHPNQHPAIHPLGLSDDELRDLEAFLEALTDEEFLNNPAFSAP